MPNMIEDARDLVELEYNNSKPKTLFSEELISLAVTVAPHIRTGKERFDAIVAAMILTLEDDAREELNGSGAVPATIYMRVQNEEPGPGKEPKQSRKQARIEARKQAKAERAERIAEARKIVAEADAEEKKAAKKPAQKRKGKEDPNNPEAGA